MCYTSLNHEMSIVLISLIEMYHVYVTFPSNKRGQIRL